MAMRSKAPKATRLALIAAAAAASALTFTVPLAGSASAATAVTIPPGNPSDGQTFAVSGTGFPTRTQAPTGLQILECSDPGGTAANLPVDATGCEGTTAKTGVFTDAIGNFSATYTSVVLNPGNSSIQCDSTHFCVLWVGVDYNTSFSSQSGFSRAFEIGAPPAMTPETAVAIVLPLTAALIAGGTILYVRRRRSHAPVAV
jgi:hypothetical protein